MWRCYYNAERLSWIHARVIIQSALSAGAIRFDLIKLGDNEKRRWRAAES